MDDPSDRVDTSATVACPYCGEMVAIELDVGGGAHQRYVQDCEVCCRPWQVEVRYTGHTAQVTVTNESG
jgi:transposase-like protein